MPKKGSKILVSETSTTWNKKAIQGLTMKAFGGVDKPVCCGYLPTSTYRQVPTLPLNSWILGPNGRKHDTDYQDSRAGTGLFSLLFVESIEGRELGFIRQQTRMVEDGYLICVSERQIRSSRPAGYGTCFFFHYIQGNRDETLEVSYHSHYLKGQLLVYTDSNILALGRIIHSLLETQILRFRKVLSMLT